jgi:F-type H+-transporting ATPase subunit c
MSIKKNKKGGVKMRRAIGTMVFLTALLLPAICFAQEEKGAESSSIKTALAIASGLAIAIAAFGGAFGQSRAITAAMEGISRNPEAQPRMFVLLILGLAFIESLVIYAFVISLMLLGKI